MEFNYKNIIKAKNRRIKELLYFNNILENQHIEKMKEIERLNNIINELYRWLDENYKITDCTYKVIEFWDLRDKIQELLDISEGGKENDIN